MERSWTRGFSWAGSAKAFFLSLFQWRFIPQLGIPAFETFKNGTHALSYTKGDKVLSSRIFYSYDYHRMASAAGRKVQKKFKIHVISYHTSLVLPYLTGKRKDNFALVNKNTVTGICSCKHSLLQKSTGSCYLLEFPKLCCIGNILLLVPGKFFDSDFAPGK